MDAKATDGRETGRSDLSPSLSPRDVKVSRKMESIANTARCLLAHLLFIFFLYPSKSVSSSSSSSSTADLSFFSHPKKNSAPQQKHHPLPRRYTEILLIPNSNNNPQQ